MLLILLSMLSCTAPTPRPEQPVVPAAQLQEHGRVILVTLDGVRWQEATTRLPSTAEWAMFGDRRSGSRVSTSSSRPLSMPGYHALMLGHTAPCADNDCPRIAAQTLPESLMQRLSLPAHEVAVFASWAAIPLAASSQEAPTFTLDSAVDSAAPWPDARLDAVTAERALEHLRTHRPRFLWISLLDTDERAHQDDWPGYLDAIDRSDRLLAELVQTVGDLGLTEQTTIILTTDHGRGRGPLWTTHGSLPAARHMWLAATGPWVQLSGTIAGGTLGQADVRPTVERLLGLEPSPCDAEGCGEPIPEIVPRIF